MELPPPLQQHQPVVERELRALLEERAASKLPLYQMMQYQLGWVDSSGSPVVGPLPDRLYGALCLEAALTTGDTTAAGPAAAAAELFYQSTAVHQDVQMGDRHTDEHPAVWWSWGPAHAINVGDGLHALARLGVFRLQAQGLSNELMLQGIRELDAAALRYYEGQFMELTYQERLDIRESDYLRMAEATRGSLVGGALALGAWAGGADGATAEAFLRWGQQMGVAAQLHEDTVEIWGPTSASGPAARLLNKSKLLPVVYALEKGTLAQKRALGEVYFKRVMEPDDVEQIRRVLDEVGAREYSQQKAQAICNEAMELLKTLSMPTQAVERWQSIADYLIQI